eukprot:3188004-Rhodomonas_salina.2
MSVYITCIKKKHVSAWAKSRRVCHGVSWKQRSTIVAQVQEPSSSSQLIRAQAVSGVLSQTRHAESNEILSVTVAVVSAWLLLFSVGVLFHCAPSNAGYEEQTL